MNVALYLRVSSEEQTRGHSLDDQRAQLEEWARREDWVISDTYEDPGISATDALKRPAFQRMIQDAGRGLFQRVLVKRRDRYSRDLLDSATYERMLKGFGVDIWSLEEPGTNDDSPAAFLIRGFTDVMSAHYSKDLSHKTSQGWHRRALKGLPAGDVPYGYRSRGQEAPELIESEAQVVRELFSSYAVGNVSLMQLAQRLNDRGVQPRSKRRSQAFGQKTVLSILQNPFYKGDIVYKGEVVSKGLHTPIIEQSLFFRAQEQLRRRASSPWSVAPSSRIYLLSGVGICSDCEQVIWSNGSQRGQWYRCSSVRKGQACSSKGAGVRAEILESQLAGLYRDWELPQSWQDRIIEIAETRESGPNRKVLEQSLERAQRLLLEGLVPEEMGRETVRALQTQLAGFTNDPEETIRAGRYLLNVRELWPRMTKEEQRQLVQLTLASVAVALDTKQVISINPRPNLQPLFQVVREAGSGPVVDSPWRPRSDSNSQRTISINRWYGLRALEVA